MDHFHTLSYVLGWRHAQAAAEAQRCWTQFGLKKGGEAQVRLKGGIKFSPIKKRACGDGGEGSYR